jgi:hypothetical protein
MKIPRNPASSQSEDAVPLGVPRIDQQDFYVPEPTNVNRAAHSDPFTYSL